MPGHTNTIMCAVELPRMGLLATGGMDGKVIFWDLRECRYTHTQQARRSKERGENGVGEDSCLLDDAGLGRCGTARPTQSSWPCAGPRTTSTAYAASPTGKHRQGLLAGSRRHVRHATHLVLHGVGCCSKEHEVVVSVGYDINGLAWDPNTFLLQVGRWAGSRRLFRRALSKS